MQTLIAICARSAAPPGVPIALAFAPKVGRRNEWVLAWPCIYCQGEHRHDSRGLQAAPCGRGMYRVVANGGRISA